MEQKAKWDMPTRVLHGIIALLIIALFASAAGMDLFEAVFGKVAEIKLKYIHLYLGLALTASVSARILWGFFGNDSVNWRGIPSGIAKYPGWAAAEIDYVLRGIDSDKRKKDGHNALAIPVYCITLAMILLQFATGLGMWDDLDKKAKKHGVVQVMTRPSVAALSNPMDTLVPNASAHADHDEKSERHDAKMEEAKGAETAGSQPTGEKANAVEAVGEKKKEETLGEEIHDLGLFWVPIFLVMHLGGIYIHYRRGERDLLKGMKIAG
jgi:cytochrome b